VGGGNLKASKHRTLTSYSLSILLKHKSTMFGIASRVRCLEHDIENIMQLIIISLKFISRPQCLDAFKIFKWAQPIYVIRPCSSA
jgi:hypothetical protein